MIRIVTFGNLMGNTSKWLFYSTKFSIKREKNSGQMGVKTCGTNDRTSPRKPASIVHRVVGKWSNCALLFCHTKGQTKSKQFFQVEVSSKK